jgi:hypothetical protein
MAGLHQGLAVLRNTIQRFERERAQTVTPESRAVLSEDIARMRQRERQLQRAIDAIEQMTEGR